MALSRNLGGPNVLQNAADLRERATASRFSPAVSDLALRVPASRGLSAAPESDPAPAAGATGEAAAADPQRVAIEAGRLVPPSGNLQIGGQQIWLGPAPAGRQVTIWADETVVHILLDGTRLKTLPSRLGVIELARLAADGARPAGPPPLRAGTGTAVEVERMVNGTGLIGLAGRQLNVGYDLAGQRVTLRMDGTQMAVLSHDGVLCDPAVPCPGRRSAPATRSPPRSQHASTRQRTGDRPAPRLPARLPRCLISS